MTQRAIPTITQEKLNRVAEVFRERIANYKNQICQQMGFKDRLMLRDCQYSSEYAEAIYQNMLKTEDRLRVSPNYLQEVQDPKEVKDTSRAFLVEWIIDVARKFRLRSETLYVTILIIDRFLSLKRILKA